jgi:hypothetical protein
MAVYRNAASRNLTSIRELSHNSNNPDPRVVCCKDIDAAPEHPDPLERIQTVRYWLDNNTEETLRLLSSRRHDTTQASRCRCEIDPIPEDLSSFVPIVASTFPLTTSCVNLTRGNTACARAN